MYYFFLSALPIPITPGALSIKTPSQNKTVTLVNEGEINIIKEQGLREISFEFLLPQQHYPFINGAKAIDDLAFTNGLDLGFIKIGRPTAGNYLASIYIPILNELKKRKKPIQFIVTRLTPDNKPVFYTNIKCAIEDFTYEEDADKHGLDVMCNITLKEYKPYATKSYSLSLLESEDTTTAKRVATMKKIREAKEPPKTYKAKDGDTPGAVSKIMTGATEKAKEVVNAVKEGSKKMPGLAIMFASNPAFLSIGTVAGISFVAAKKLGKMVIDAYQTPYDMTQKNGGK